MPRIDIPDVTARTTSDRAGHAHMVVASTGEAPMDALGGLVRQAEAEAERIAGGFRGGEHATTPDAVWKFEVVDVRLVPGVVSGGAQNWAAYGDPGVGRPQSMGGQLLARPLSSPEPGPGQHRPRC